MISFYTRRYGISLQSLLISVTRRVALELGIPSACALVGSVEAVKSCGKFVLFESLSIMNRFVYFSFRLCHHHRVSSGLVAPKCAISGFFVTNRRIFVPCGGCYWNVTLLSLLQSFASLLDWKSFVERLCVCRATTCLFYAASVLR